MANGVRINNLNQATSLNDTDTITIIQDDENKKASISLLDKDGTYMQSVVNTIPDLITTSKANVETTKQSIDEKFGDDKFSTQIITSQEMSSVGVSDDDSVDVSSQVQDGFMESAALYGKTQYYDTTADIYYDSMPEDTTGMTLELVSVKMPILTVYDGNITNIPLSFFESGNYDYNGWTNFNINCSNVKITAKLNNFLGSDYSLRMLLNNNQAINLTSFEEKVISLNNLKNIGFHNGVSLKDGNIGNLLDYLTTGALKLKIEINGYPPYPNYDGSTKTNILTVNEDVELRSNGSVYDELDLLTGKLTQRIDEDGEVLAKEVIKTVDLNSSNGDVKTPVVYKNGHILLQSDGLVPELRYSIPISYSGLIAQNTMTNLKHSWRLDELEIMAYTSIVNSQYESLILVATAETNEVVVSSDYAPDESLYNMLKVLVNANALENADEKINVFYLYGKLSDEMYMDLIMGDDM